MISEELRLVFVHIPKTAGMSLARAFGIKWQVEMQKQAHEFEQLRDQGYLAFAVIREPVDRLRSAFRYMKSKPYYAGRPIMGGEDRELEFEAWVEYNLARYQGDLTVEDVGGQQKKRFQRGASFWFAPQMSWLDTGGGALDVDRLLLFDGLPNNVESLMRERGWQGRLPHANRTSGQTSGTLGQSALSEVHELYSADYRMLGMFDAGVTTLVL